MVVQLAVPKSNKEIKKLQQEIDAASARETKYKEELKQLKDKIESLKDENIQIGLAYPSTLTLDRRKTADPDELIAALAPTGEWATVPGTEFPVLVSKRS